MITHTFSIIIVTWNALPLLKRYLPSVAKTNYPAWEVLIADNGSTDGSAEWVEEHIPECRVIRLGQNYGYCGGNNRCAEKATGDILLFLNNDVEVSENWLDSLNVLFQDPKVAVAQPKLRSVTRPAEFEYAGGSGGFIDRLGYPFCRGRIMDHLEPDIGQYDDQRPIFWASGAAFAIRRDLFFCEGGFDEDFEFHMEEIDLCWQVQRSGGIITVEPKSVVWHYGGGSLPAQNPRKIYYNFRNSLIMLTKHVEKRLIWTIFQRLVLDGLAGIRFLADGKPAFTIAIIRAHFHYYAMLRSTLRKRANLKKTHLFRTDPTLILPHLIPFEYHLKGKKRFSDLSMPPPRENP